MSKLNSIPFFTLGSAESAEIIPYADAMVIHEMYKEHPDCLRYPDGRIMKGFRIGKNHIEAMLDLDDFKEMFVFFAVHPTTKNRAVNEQKFTMVFSPLKATDDNDIYGEIIQSGPLYEYVDPCPDKCPRDFRR